MMSRATEISNAGTAAVDLISECPDSVLVHVLSLLPIEDAVKTGVLSKRWQFLWTFLPSLVFHSSVSVVDYDSDDEDTLVAAKTGFATFVEKTLFFSKLSKLKKFRVSLEYEPYLASKVNTWTRFAVGKEVEELHLGFYNGGGDYELPQLLYDNSCFIELQFLYCKVIPKGNVAWGSLKNLTIGHVKLTNDAIERILAGSPVLEILKLVQCPGFSRLAVTNSCVKKVILDFPYPWASDGIDDVLEISAPYLLSVEITGFLIGNFSGRIARGCRLMNVSSLVDAVFNFARISDEDWANDYERIQNIVGGILASLRHVKNLTLGTWVLEALSIMEAKGSSSSFLNCKCLTLDTQIDNKNNEYVFPGIASMLQKTSNLETLIVNLSFGPFCLAECYGMTLAELCNYNEQNYWTSQKWSYKCLTLHLKNVTFTGSVSMTECYDSNDTSFCSFMQFLLWNARVLQKMVIRKPSDNQLKEYFFNAVQKLLSYPRSSPDAAVIFR